MNRMNENVLQKGTTMHYLGPGKPFCGWAVLCIEEYLATFLGSVYAMLVGSLLHLTNTVKSKNVSRWCQMSWGGEGKIASN